MSVEELRKARQYSEAEPFSLADANVAADGESDSALTNPHTDKDTDTFDITMTDDNSEPTIDDLSVDALAERHEGVAELQTDVENLRAAIDEKEEQLETVKDAKDDLEQAVEALDSGETTPRFQLVNDLMDLAEGAGIDDRWAEEELLDLDRDRLEDRLELVRDIAADADLDVDDESGDDDSESSGSSASATPTVDRSGAEMDVEPGGTYDLSNTA